MKKKLILSILPISFGLLASTSLPVDLKDNKVVSQNLYNHRYDIDFDNESSVTHNIGGYNDDIFNGIENNMKYSQIYDIMRYYQNKRS